MENFKEYAPVAYPVADKFYESALGLPLFSFMTKEEVRHVCSLVQEFYAR